DRMMQRKARRDTGIPMDLNPDNDVRTEYSREQINRYLGWLAVCLSTQMQTVLPLNRLYSFLERDGVENQKDKGWLTTKMTNAILIFLCTLMIGLPLVSVNLNKLLHLGLISASAATLYLLACRRVFVAPLADLNGLKRTIDQIAFIGIFRLFPFYLGSIVMALVAIWPAIDSPILIGSFVLVFFVSISFILLQLLTR